MRAFHVAPTVSLACFVLLAGNNAPEPTRGPTALDVARALVERTPAAELEATIEDDPTVGIPLLSALAEAAVEADDRLSVALRSYLVSAARSRGARLAKQEPPWSSEQVLAFLTLLFLDPRRIEADASFKAFVMSVVPDALSAQVPAVLRDRLLAEINLLPGLEFDDTERIEVAWGASRRRSATRQMAFDARGVRVVDDVSGSISASVFSLPGRFFDTGEALKFLGSVRRMAPTRTLIAMTDATQARRLRASAAELEVHLVASHGQDYSPWPRDPFTFLLRRNGGVDLLVRPNRQQARPADETMGRELIQGLSERLDDQWGRLRWAVSPVPFHNGQILLLSDRVWITAHTLEARVLQLLESPAVPVDTLPTLAGWNRYAAAVRAAADELARLYDRPVELVHPFPMTGRTPPAPTFLRALGGGAGFDLDSILTPFVDSSGAQGALVGDLSLGQGLIRHLEDASLDGFAHGYGFQPVTTLQDRLLTFQSEPRAADLQAFLDTIADTLRQRGTRVLRLPLILVPAEVVSHHDRPPRQPFLITWNNVVQQPLESGRRAEGFGSLFDAGDELAREIFATAGYELALVPPLVQSVIRNGGYRCASQHLRE